MDTILAIETATRVCSVAVSSEGKILGETSIYVPQSHAERLVIIMDGLMAGLKLSYRELEAVAVSIGPGSFTGLRIGLSVAKGIAFGQHKKLIAVPTLEAIALGSGEFAGDEKPIVAILHARANEFYYSSFEWMDSELQTRSECRVAAASDLAAEFPQSTVFVGEGADEFSRCGGIADKFDARRFKPGEASAKEVALIATEKMRRGEFSDLRSLVPMYIKDFVAIPRRMEKAVPHNKHLEKI